MPDSKYNYRKFVGLPYQEPFGCFQLVRHVYKEMYNLPIRDIKDIAVKVRDPQEGDVVLFDGEVWHVGLVIREGEMIHCYRGGTSCVESYLTMRWRNRIVGFYRHVQLQGALA